MIMLTTISQASTISGKKSPKLERRSKSEASLLAALVVAVIWKKTCLSVKDMCQRWPSDRLRCSGRYSVWRWLVVKRLSGTMVS